jgi:hypothetical protein
MDWQSLYATKSQQINNKIDQLVNELHIIYKKSKEEKIRFLVVKGIPLALLIS